MGSGSDGSSWLGTRCNVQPGKRSVQQRMPAISCRNFADRERPLDTQSRVGRTQPALSLGRIRRAMQVEQLDIVGERLKAVRTSRGYEECGEILRALFVNAPLQERGRASANVYRNIPHSATETTH